MIDRKTLKMAWALLDKREKRKSVWVLLIVVVSALSASIMVASIMPFLAVLSDPARIHEVPLLSTAYEMGGFNSDRSFLFALGLASVTVTIIANLIQIVRVHVVMRFALMRAHTISYRLLESYLRQPYTYFLNEHSGRMGTQVLDESQQVVTQFFRPAVEGFASLITLAALLILIIYVNPSVSIGVMLVFGSIYGSTLLLTQRKVRHLGKERAAANAARHQLANEALGGIKELRLLGRERVYLGKYYAPSLRMGMSMARVNAMQQTPQYVMQASVFAGLIILCLILLGTEGPGQNSMADILPTIGLIALAGQRMIPELSKLFLCMTQLNYGGPAVQTVYRDMIKHGGNIDLPANPPAALGLKSEIQLDNVSYYYGNAGNAGLTDISLSIRAGEKIGIVGTTGAGKSTLANILLGLIQPTAGRLIIDGKDITPANTRAWQRSIGYVAQEIYLVDATIRENIAFGVPRDEIDEDRLLEAGRIAHLHDFIINELEKGYDTTVGERGVRLSGGQRQRIGIARALYNNGDLIILDEATSALDNVTESEVMQAIDNLPGDKTLIMIAHRLTTLRGCDRILVLDKGRISAFGKWEELVTHNVIFRNLALSKQNTNQEAQPHEMQQPMEAENKPD